MKAISLRAVGNIIYKNAAWYYFLMQGFGKIFKFTVPKVYDMFFKDFETTFLPKW